MKPPYIQWLWRCTAILYLSILLYIVFFARRRRGKILFQHSEWNIKPVKGKWWYIQSWATLHPQIKYGFIENLVGNIILFVPFSFFLFFLFQLQKFRNNILLSCLVSICIELVQFITGKGVADIDDVLLNTLGAVVGFVLSKWLYRIMPAQLKTIH
jgi:glycopeptide antibiotics resistance protein